MLRRTTWHTQSSLVLISSLLLFVSIFINTNATPTNSTSINATNATTNDTNSNFHCPEDCHCVIPATHHGQAKVHHQFLHAKCSSLKGLQSHEASESTLPIHSIDLSYLGLTRLSHALEKLHDLTSIDLSHNELHEFGHLGRRIKKLSLKHNRITSSKLLKLPQHVQYLNLQHNDITNLPLEFTQLSQLQTLELSHNPINCSCETLEVRNWLQERHVFMENAVKCSYPVEAKDKSWLQVKKETICEKEKRQVELASTVHQWDVNENDNELMMGDQPAMEGSGGDVDEEDELGKAFMLVKHKDTPAAGNSNELHVPDDVEGSGDLTETNMQLQLSTEGSKAGEGHEMMTTEEPLEDEDLDEDEEDGSGSGGGILLMPQLYNHAAFDDFDAPVTHLSAHDSGDDKAFDNRGMEEPLPEATPSPAIFSNGMGIFEDSVSDKPVDEDVIVPVVHHELDANTSGNTINSDVITEVTTEGVGGKDAAIMQAKVGEDNDSNATYFLFGVIALIVVGLLLFVAIKQCKNRRNARHDAENPRQTELLDMDKKNLGKPLLGEKTKADMAKPINGANSAKKPYDSNDVKDGANQNQPLLKNGNGAGPKDGELEPTIEQSKTPTTLSQSPPPHEYYPITPRYPTPKSPRASKYAQYPQNPESNNNTINADDAYLPSSPKSGRYSPVYSPETGRVKIKLTETPKPKTPMLVNRSTSNAGEIITTPVHNGTGAGGRPTVTNGHAGHY